LLALYQSNLILRFLVTYVDLQKLIAGALELYVGLVAINVQQPLMDGTVH
jgi:hypothetical protein